MTDIQSFIPSLEKAVNGSLEDFRYVSKCSRATFLQACSFLGARVLILKKASLLHLLVKFKNGKIEEPEMQAWAFFVRHGFVFEHGLGASLNIDYEHEHEELMNEVTYRLEELGDIIDGEISKEELETMILSLNRAGGSHL